MLGQLLPCRPCLSPPLHVYTHTAVDCRAILVQLGFYAHMRLALEGGAAAAASAAGAAAGGGGGLPLSLGLVASRPLAFATAFMLLFSVVIALFKDIPDVAGDSKVRGDALDAAVCCAELSCVLVAKRGGCLPAAAIPCS